MRKCQYISATPILDRSRKCTHMQKTEQNTYNVAQISAREEVIINKHVIDNCLSFFMVDNEWLIFWLK